MSDYNMYDSNLFDSEYENVISINTDDLLTQTNTVGDSKEIKKKVNNESNKVNKITEENKKKINEEKKYETPLLINSEKDNIAKYGDDEKYEAWSDNNIFFPLANKLVRPFHDLGLTPNMVTYIGTLCTLLAIYYISINEFKYAAIAYFIGYLFDCVDGKLARKYNMTSKDGMVLDLVSDNITNLILLLYLSHKYGRVTWFTLLIFVMSMLLSLSYGLNEAIASQKATGSDNFFLRRKKELEGTSNILDNIYLLITGLTYSSYRNFFPTYNEEQINKWLVILKEFGPGNYTLLVTFIIFNLGNEKSLI